MHFLEDEKQREGQSGSRFGFVFLFRNCQNYCDADPFELRCNLFWGSVVVEDKTDANPFEFECVKTQIIWAPSLCNCFRASSRKHPLPAAVTSNQAGLLTGWKRQRAGSSGSRFGFVFLFRNCQNYCDADPFELRCNLFWGSVVVEDKTDANPFEFECVKTQIIWAPSLCNCSYQLDSVPRAKYALSLGEFKYWEHDGRHWLMWVDIPPFGRPYYVLEEAKWGYLD